MKMIQLLGALVFLIMSVFVGGIVHHSLADHGHLDLFHLVVATVLGIGGLLLLYRVSWRAPRAR